ncbi:MAG: lipid II:glycine glycyltransferase (peptidoglycan interpeptide bridge formation enzyme) [Mariniflexile sp.]
MDKVTLEIITSQDKWNGLLKEIDNLDFYHTFDYHIVEKTDSQTPILIKYTENNIVIALPLLIRKISNTEYYDATSVYGYAGPISKGIDMSFDNALFTKKLIDYFIKNKIVSVFSRLNPYINYQKNILINCGEIVDQGKIVFIDLRLREVDQIKKYQKRLKTYINKARKKCFISKAESKEDIKEFIAIYYENMERVNAARHYFFSNEYFKGIMESNDFEAEIYLAKDSNSGNTMAGCVFVTINNIVHYHLSGCKEEYLDVAPVKLLIDNMRLVSSKKELHYFNLGGGLGANQEDSLFRFKSSFSKDFRGFNLWKLIVNEDIYNHLVEINKVTDETDYFPKYRFIENKLNS